jgi:hypothetical protein
MKKSSHPAAWAVSLARSRRPGLQDTPQWRHVRAYGREIDLAAAFRQPAGIVASLYTQLRVPAGGLADLRVTCDGGVEVWLDGYQAPAATETRPLAELNLEGGPHELVLSVGVDRPARTVAAELTSGEGVSYSCSRPPGAQQPDHISGVFLYWGNRFAQEDLDQWRERFAFLGALGMDSLIVQFSVVEGTAFYPSHHLSTAAPAGVDPTERMLTAAAERGFSVHLGVASDERNWWDIPYRPADLPKYVDEESDRNNRIAQELVALYRDSPALAGIYLSHEIHLGDEWGDANMPHLVELFNRMSDEVHRLAPELAVSTAPFFSLRGSIEQYEDRWRRFLDQTRLDLLMLQDGVGCERHITVDSTVPYYQATERACAAAGVEFWTDLELFDLNPPHTVPPERVRAQLTREAGHVQKVVAYSLGDLTPEFAASLPGVTLADAGRGAHLANEGTVVAQTTRARKADLGAE